MQGRRHVQRIWLLWLAGSRPMVSFAQLNDENITVEQNTTTTTTVNVTAILQQQCYSEQEWRSQGALDFAGAFRRCGPDLVCVTGHPSCEEYCVANEECQGFPMRLCGENYKCRHKGLFGQHPGPDIGAAISFFFISGLALSAGIGGGGLYVPLLMIILGFTVRNATALSQACLAGGASSALVYNLRQRHPSGHKPMIDYDLVLVMGPNLLAGAVAGSILNAAVPSWLILVLLVMVLTHSAYKAYEKAIKTWRKESAGEVSVPKDTRLSKNPIDRCIRFLAGNRYAHFDEPHVASRSGAAVPPQVVGVAAAAVSEADVDLSVVEQCSESSVTSSPKQQLPQFPAARLALFGATWLIVIISIFARGGHATSGIVPYCSFAYWLLAGITAGILACISIFSAIRAVSAAQAGDAASAGGTVTTPGVGDFVWTLRATVQIALWSLIAGTIAALCGIGGGMIMGPRLLELGFLPQVQSATTATTLFVMSTSTCIAFLVEGAAQPDYALWLAFATSLGAVGGKAIVGWIVKRFRRPSVIMFILAGIIGVSVVVMSITGLIDVINDIEQGKDMAFKGPCQDDASE